MSLSVPTTEGVLCSQTVQSIAKGVYAILPLLCDEICSHRKAATSFGARESNLLKIVKKDGHWRVYVANSAVVTDWVRRHIVYISFVNTDKRKTPYKSRPRAFGALAHVALRVGCGTSKRDVCIVYFSGGVDEETLTQAFYPCKGKQVFEGDRGQERLVCIHINESGSYHFEGIQSEEHLVKVFFTNGDEETFEGKRGHERTVKYCFKDQSYQLFEGNRGDERLLSWHDPTKNTCRMYSGAKGHERLVCLKDGLDVRMYEGERNFERLVSACIGSQFTYFFEGAKGMERITHCRHTDDNRLILYEGPKNCEHIVCVEMPNGSRTFYKGDKGEETIVRTELPDGTVQFFEGTENRPVLVRSTKPLSVDGDSALQQSYDKFYEGPSYSERLVCVAHPKKGKWYFEGTRKEEHLVRHVDLDNTVTHYVGERYSERKVRTVAKTGTTTYFQGKKGHETPVCCQTFQEVQHDLQIKAARIVQAHVRAKVLRSRFDNTEYSSRNVTSFPTNPCRSENDFTESEEDNQTKTTNCGTRRSKQVADSVGTCVVCFDNAKSHAFVPCGHLCVCQNCAEAVKQMPVQTCPLCRSEFVSVVQIFC